MTRLLGNFAISKSWKVGYRDQIITEKSSYCLPGNKVWNFFLSYPPVDDTAGPWNTAMNAACVLHTTTALLLSPRNALRRGYSNAAVVPSVCPCVCPSRFDLVNTIETEPLCASSSNLADMFTMTRGWTLLILEVRGQRSRSQLTYMEISLWTR